MGCFHMENKDLLNIESFSAGNDDSIITALGACEPAIKKLVSELTTRIKESEDILSIGYELASQKNSRDIYRAVTANALKITGWSAASLVLFDEKAEMCQLVEISGYSRRPDGSAWELTPGGTTEALLEASGPLFIEDVKAEPLFDNPVMGENTTSVLAAALKEGDETIGLLFVGDFEKREKSTTVIARFAAYCAQASLALQKALLLEKNEELSVTDCLTGLNNSRSFLAALDMEMQRTNRYGSYFSILLIDIDNLNDINDLLGHSKGDKAIQKVAETIADCSRQTDFKARYAGDEFGIILPNTSCQQATTLANRIRRQVNDLFLEANGKEAQLSVSIGIAEFPCLGTTADALMNAARTALYVCKQRGRNLVCCYEKSEEHLLSH